MKLILASASPRRRELLQVITKDFEVVTANVDERAIEDEIMLGDGDMLSKAKDLVLRLSRSKAQAVFDKVVSDYGEDVVVIGSDTCVVTADEIMGKPVDKDDARRILHKLSEAEHYVLTGVCIYSGDKVENFYESSLVRFNSLDEYQINNIERYIDTPEPYDKAGAYGIQGNAMILIQGIEGDYYNIMGLPVNALARRLYEF